MNDLEFQLTLQTKLEPPPKPQPVAASPTKSMGHKKTPSAFSRFWSSPKKRKEQELKQQEEAERAARQQQLEIETRRNSQPTAWDLLHDLVGPDGSFARAYVCLKNHEREAFGRPFSVDIPLFNEWAVEDSAAASSVKSKRGGVVRKPPYRVGKLTLQLLYVPKPPEAKEEDMPKSMNACIRELKEAEDFKDRAWEGHLSQQGGDCPVSLDTWYNVFLSAKLTMVLVLASEVFQAFWDKADSISRDDPSAAGHDQSGQSYQAHR